jgi:hypothetical protein
VNAGVDYINAKDQTSVTAAALKGEGFSIWVNPRSTKRIEALARYDDLKPNKDGDGRREIFIGGVAYWFPLQGGVTSAIMLDVEHYTFDAFQPPQPDQNRIFLHTLVNF